MAVHWTILNNIGPLTHFMKALLVRPPNDQILSQATLFNLHCPLVNTREVVASVGEKIGRLWLPCQKQILVSLVYKSPTERGTFFAKVTWLVLSAIGGTPALGRERDC